MVSGVRFQVSENRKQMTEDLGIEGFRDSGIKKFKTLNPKSLILYPMPSAPCPMLYTLTPDTRHLTPET
jgi:hypothetical protein